jgi:ferredoxin
MKVVVNYACCNSNGVCTYIAPEIFEIRADGYLYILNGYDEALHESLLVLAREAVKECPTQALSIEE